MKREIWKFNLGIPADTSIVNIPVKGIVKKLLSAQLQNGHAVLWAEVEPNSNGDIDSYLNVDICWTGFTVPDNDYQYVGTIQAMNGLVYHYYVKNSADMFDV